MADPTKPVKETEEEKKERVAREAMARAQAARDAAQAETEKRKTAAAPIAVDAAPLVASASAKLEAERIARETALAKQKEQEALAAAAALKAVPVVGNPAAPGAIQYSYKPPVSPDALTVGELAGAARESGKAASSAVPGLGAAPGSTTPAGAAADASRLSAQAIASGKTPAKPADTVAAASAIVKAPAGRVEALIEKLKAEEKKGGPGIFDIIEAAAAGWRGKVPLYTQKALEAAAEEARLEQIKTTAELQAGIDAEQQAEAFKRQSALQMADIASQEKIAGLRGGQTGMSPLTLGFLGGK